MPILEIITIGTELLLGEINDTNSTYIARVLRDHGIDIYRITTIGDNPARITAAIQEALERSDIIITTGGLGPTVDDPTRQAVADAADRELVFLDELWDQILERFKAYNKVPTENNRRQAMIPKGALPIPNPVGTAPCYVVDFDTSCIISLPGVPLEMETILHDSIIPFLKKKYNLKTQIIKTCVLHSAGLGESLIDQLISDLEENKNPTVGLLAHPGQVDIRVTAKASSEPEAFEMIQPIIDEIYQRIGDNIFGKDDETLEYIISVLLCEHGLDLSMIEHGLNREIIKRFEEVNTSNIIIKHIDKPVDNLDLLSKKVTQSKSIKISDIGFGLALIDHGNFSIHLVFEGPNHQKSTTMQYGGPPGNASLWAQNVGLEFLRQNLIQETGIN